MVLLRLIYIDSYFDSQSFNNLGYSIVVESLVGFLGCFVNLLDSAAPLWTMVVVTSAVYWAAFPLLATKDLWC